MNERKEDDVLSELVCNQGGYPIYRRNSSVNPASLCPPTELPDQSGFLLCYNDVELWGELKRGLTYLPRALTAFFLVDLGLVFYGVLRNMWWKWWIYGDRTLATLWEILFSTQVIAVGDLGIVILGESIFIMVAFLWVIKK